MATTGDNIKTYLLSRVNDPDGEEWDDDTLILRYINNAIIALSDFLVASKDKSRMNSLNITDNMAVPSTFGTFSGQYPIYQSGGSFHLHTGTQHSTQYFKKIAVLSTLSETIDMDDKYVPIIGEMTVAQAYNQSEKGAGMSNALELSKMVQDLAKGLF